MPVIYIVALLSIFLLSAPAQAGRLDSSGGKGVWISTECKAPELPRLLQKDPETRANDLNAEVAEHNAFVAEANIYMNCLSREAENDSRSISQLIVQEASRLIDQTNADVKRSADSVQ